MNTTTQKLTSLPGFGFYLLCAVYALGMVGFTEYLADNSIGKLVSYGSVAGAIALAVVNFRYGLLASLLILFTFPSFPRDILDQYAALGMPGFKLEFASPKFDTFAGFALAIWMMLALSGLAAIRFMQRGFIIDSRPLQQLGMLMLLFTGTLLLASAWNVMGGAAFDAKEAISGLRFPLMFALGALIGWAYFDAAGRETAIRDMVAVGFVVLLVSGFKSLLFLANDHMNGVFKLSMTNPATVIMPLLLAFIWVADHIKGKAVALGLIMAFGAVGAIPDGRGPIIIYMLTLVTLFGLVLFKSTKRFVGLFAKTVLFLGLGIALLLAAAVSNERLMGFLAYKTDFLHSSTFYSAMSHSPAVRVYEAKNIFAEAADDGVALAIGKGPAGTFTYKNYPFYEPFTVSDYSEKELRAGQYFKPHLFTNYWLLKGGMFGLFIYTGVFLWLGVMAYRNFNSQRPWTEQFVLAFVMLATPGALMQAFWQPDYTMYFAIIFAIVALAFRNNDTNKEEHSHA